MSCQDRFPSIRHIQGLQTLGGGHPPRLSCAVSGALGQTGFEDGCYFKLNQTVDRRGADCMHLTPHSETSQELPSQHGPCTNLSEPLARNNGLDRTYIRTW